MASRALALLFLALFAMAVSVSFIFAVLPPVGRQLGLSELRIALIVAPASLVFVLANPVWGALCERLGRKRAIVAALAAATAANTAFGVVVDFALAGTIAAGTAFVLLASFRAIMAAFSAGVLPGVQAYIAHSTASDRRTGALATVGAGFALGLVSGPALAAATATLGQAVPFYSVAVLAGAATLAIVLLLPESQDGRSAAQRAAGTTPFAQLWPLLAITLLVFSAYGALLQVTAFRLQDQFGLSLEAATSEAGVALALLSLALVVTQVAQARARLSPERARLAPLLGAALGIGALALLAAADALAVQYVALGLFGIGLGIALPSIQSLLTVSAEAAGDQGRVAGFGGAAQGFGMMVGPLTGAVSYRLGVAVPYLAGIAVLAVAAALAVRFRPPAPRNRA